MPVERSSTSLRWIVPADSQSSSNAPDLSDTNPLLPNINATVPRAPELRSSFTAFSPSENSDGDALHSVQMPSASTSRPVSPRKPGRSQSLKVKLPRIDQCRAPHRRAEVLCNQWIASHRREQSAAVAVVDIARELFYDAVVRQYVFISSDGHEQMRLLAVRAAVSCLLLEEIVNALPRHVEMLRPYVDILVQSVYVPDTPEVLKALGGSVAYTQLFVDMPRVSSAKTASAVHAVLTRYARKPYFVAHHELSQKVIAYSHNNLSQVQHFKRISGIFALLNRNWIKSFLRIVVKAWRCICQNRRENEQKHRARWAQRFASERIRTTLREWHDFATYRLQRAIAAETINSQIRAIEQSIRDLKEQVSGLTTESASLSEELTAKDELHVDMEKKIGEREEEYKVKLDYVREMDRVGSQLLDTLLQSMPFPAGGEQMPPLELLVLWANTKLVESVFGPLYLSPTDEEFVEFVENVSSMPTKHSKSNFVSVSDVADAALPFTPLLAESATVYVPFHRYMALMRIMDADAGPTNEELTSISISDRRVWEQRSAMEAKILSSLPGEAVKAPSRPVADTAGAKKTSDEADLAEMEETVGELLVEAYKRVTGSECVVTAKQLLTRQRGTQLVFLASLMRYFANWIESKVKKQQEGSVDSNHLHGSSTATTLTMDGEIEMSDTEIREAVERFRGKRHLRYREWCHPPQTHLEWAARVEDQRRWIAASFSALHAAITVTRAPHIVLSSEEEEAMPTFTANVTPSRISDILPEEVMDSPVLFLRIVRCVETSFSRIYALFSLYALPFTAPGKPTVHCVTALDFWRMLRDCAVVGDRVKLHRVAVRRIISCIVDASTATMRKQPSKVHSATGNAHHSVRRARGGARDAVELDLTCSHYRTRLDAAEFTEALLRCAQVWDGMLFHQRGPSSSQLPPDTQAQTSPDPSFQQTLHSCPSADASSVDVGKDPPAEAQTQIYYEPCDFSWTLRPSAVQDFFSEWIIPHGFRGPALSAFRRGIRHAALRERFSACLDALFGIFAGYARPKEAYGMRAAGKTNRQKQIGAVDVGIARVLSLAGMQRMVRDFGWGEVRRVTPQVVEELFESVAADKGREPGVLFFPEWIDVLCAFAMYRDPDPRRALYEKTNDFLDNYVLKHFKEED